MNFEFDPIKHRYTLDGKPLTGVTTILGVIAKNALIQWSADETAKFLGWFNEKYDDGTGQAKLAKRFAELKKLTPIAFYGTLTEARSAHRKKKEKAGEAGTNVHLQIEHYIKGQPFDTMTPQVKGMVEKFVKWAVENKVKFLESEKRLYSRKFWYAGTMDFVAEIDGKVWIGDVKTASGIYPEYFFQTAGYQLALQEMGEYPNIEGHIIVNCKKTGEFEVQRSYGYLQNVEAFKAALIIYRAQEALKVTL